MKTLGRRKAEKIKADAPIVAQVLREMANEWNKKAYKSLTVGEELR